MTQPIDTSPARLIELAKNIYRESDLSDYSDVLYAIADEKENGASLPICPTCGSDCNERDELIKAEREIERLQGLLAEKEAQPSPADVPLPEPYAWRAVGGSIWGHKSSHNDTPMYDKEAMMRYGQACAKAAKKGTS